jgi:hypothetical protein
MLERWVTRDEVRATVEHGERFPGRRGRTGFRSRFAFEQAVRGRRYSEKEVEVYAVDEFGDWIVITVISKLF